MNTLSDKKKVKTCRGCPALKFASKEEYIIHLKDVHEGKEIFHMCSTCGKQYRTKSELDHHNRSECGTKKIFKCQNCNNTFMTAGSLHNHMLRHKSDPSFMCRYCAKLFLTSGQLKIHERIHTKEKVFTCEVCSKSFCHRQSLITHNTTHTGIKPFQCDSCGNSYSCIGNLIKHRKIRMETCGKVPLTSHRVQNPATKIKLQINTPNSCRVKTIEKSEHFNKKVEEIRKNLEICKGLTVDVNMINTTEDDLGRIKDGECAPTFVNDAIEVKKCSNATDTDISGGNGCSFGEETDLSDAISDKKPESARRRTNLRYYKSKCRKLKKLETEFAEFLQQRYTENIEALPCRYCNRKYTQIRWLFKHEKQHFTSKQRMDKQTKHSNSKSKCSICKMQFSNFEEKNTHQREKHRLELICKECGKEFSNTTSLRVHIKVIHQGSPRKTYSYICDGCGVNFTSKISFQEHQLSKCQTLTPFKCYYCSKSFSRKNTLINHMAVHSSEKKYQCKFCPKSFHWKSQLQVHHRMHTNSKPYKCSYCPKKFAYKQSLDIHNTTHTNMKPVTCKACGKGFSCGGNLVKHKKTHYDTCAVWYSQNV